MSEQHDMQVEDTSKEQKMKQYLVYANNYAINVLTFQPVHGGCKHDCMSKVTEVQVQTGITGITVLTVALGY